MSGDPDVVLIDKAEFGGGLHDGTRFFLRGVEEDDPGLRIPQPHQGLGRVVHYYGVQDVESVGEEIREIKVGLVWMGQVRKVDGAGVNGVITDGTGKII